MAILNRIWGTLDERMNSITTKTFSILAFVYVSLSSIFYISLDKIQFDNAKIGLTIIESLKIILYIIFLTNLVRHFRSSSLIAWKLIIIATLIWLPGQISLAVNPLANNSIDFSTKFADFFLVCAIPVLIVGILALGLHGLQRREKLHLLVHSITLGSCVAFIGIAYFSSVHSGVSLNLDNYLLEFVAFTLDVIIIAIATSLILYRRKEVLVLFVLLGLVLHAFANILYVISTFEDGGSYDSVQRILAVVTLILWLYAVIQKKSTPTQKGEVKNEVLIAVTSYSIIAILLVFGFINVDNLMKLNTVVIYSFLVMIVMILIAQIIGFIDNKKLVSNQLQSIHDISKSEEKYHELATRDTLTDLVNRTYFIERLEYELNEMDNEEVLAVMFIDLDRFKELNDTFGHESGDLVIKTIAQRIETSVAHLGLVCRLGGDEFAVLVRPPADKAVTFDLAKNILAEVVKPIDIFGHETYLTCSIGIASSDVEENFEPQVILRNADAAMYKAKELGRNRIEYANESLKPASEIARWSLSDLHKAIVQDEIEIYFQPIVDLETNITVSFESLARWNHKEYGEISPSDFIPVAEDNGLIIDLGDTVIRRSLEQLSLWDKKYGDNGLHININLSLRQLNHSSFLSDLMGYCAKYYINPMRVNFEMTESALLGDARGVMSTLSEMKSQGFNLYIDDFGTGYSSLTYLKKFPVQGFKIDRSFIQGYGHNENDTAIVNALVALGKSMGIVVTAEGVQSKEMRDILKEMGCTQAQGYFYSKALDADDVPSSMVQGRILKSVETA